MPHPARLQAYHNRRNTGTAFLEFPLGVVVFRQPGVVRTPGRPLGAVWAEWKFSNIIGESRVLAASISPMRYSKPRPHVSTHSVTTVNSRSHLYTVQFLTVPCDATNPSGVGHYYFNVPAILSRFRWKAINSELA